MSIKEFESEDGTLFTNSETLVRNQSSKKINPEKDIGKL